MSSIATTVQSVLDREGYGFYGRENVAREVVTALTEREQVIAEQIVGEVVRQFGVSEDAVRVRLSQTGMAVNGTGGTVSAAFVADDEADIEDEDEDEDEADALFTEPDEDTRQPEPVSSEQTGGDDLAQAVTALIRAITARLA